MKPIIWQLILVLPYPQTLKCLGRKCPNGGTTDKLWDGNKYECSRNKLGWAKQHKERRWRDVHKFCWDCAHNTDRRHIRTVCPGDSCMSRPTPDRKPKEIWRWTNSSFPWDILELWTISHFGWSLIGVITCMAIIVYLYTCTIWPLRNSWNNHWCMHRPSPSLQPLELMASGGWGYGSTFEERMPSEKWLHPYPPLQGANALREMTTT